MDVDWCLSCDRKLDGLPAPSGPYCSPECLSCAQPSASQFLPDRPLVLPDSGTFRISQWARAIPPHVPAGAPLLPFTDLPLSSSPPLLSEPIPSPRPRPRLQSTPKLIERTAACTPLPTLCVSSSAHVRPPHPPRAQSHSYSQRTTTSCMSEASTSLSSLLSEPMVATPDEDASFGANIGALVRCWVGRDRANSTKSTSQDWVIEKVTDYFPPISQPKKTALPSSSAKKSSKRSPPRSPAPVSARKPSAKMAVTSPDRDHSTPTYSHTPTPVVFPSCRAWVDDEDQVRDELLVAPQPQYHPAFYLKCDQVDPGHWTRAPSLSSSISSAASSVLFMTSRRPDGVRGRKNTCAVMA